MGKEHIYILLTSLFLVFCTGSPNGDMDRFDAYISEIPLVPSSNTYLNSNELAEAGVYGIHAVVADTNGRLILVDNTNWSLHLFDRNGNSITRSGGTGRGPGEFSLINQIGLKPDGTLFVLDLRSKRVTFFHIRETHFEKKDEINLPVYELQSLRSLYFIRDDIYGVLRPHYSIDSDRPFYLYKLNHRLEPVEQLVKLPGNELIETHFGSRSHFTDNVFGVGTEWYFFDNRFYHAQTRHLRVNQFDLSTYETDSLFIPDIPLHQATPNKIGYLNERFASFFQQRPELKDYLDRMEHLQLFRRFLVDGNRIYFTMFNPGNNPGTLLVFDTGTKQRFRISTPPMYRLFQVHENRLIGIEYFDMESNRIVIIEMKDGMFNI